MRARRMGKGLVCRTETAAIDIALREAQAAVRFDRQA